MRGCNKTLIRKVYFLLFEAFGPQNWWPGETQFEVIVGAILTQNTNWGNVEKAIRNLKQHDCLTIEAVNKISHHKLATLIKPSGFFNIKSKRLKNFVKFIVEEYSGDLRIMMNEDVKHLRLKMLEVNGVGPETVDSILLYALKKPIFVVDAYTKRIFLRHRIINESYNYHEIQNVFMNSFKKDIKIFNEYHALIVRLGKNFCKIKPQCGMCPLASLL